MQWQQQQQHPAIAIERLPVMASSSDGPPNRLRSLACLALLPLPDRFASARHHRAQQGLVLLHSYSQPQSSIQKDRDNGKNKGKK